MAKYMFIYESPVPVITRKQILKRIEREGSDHDKVFIYDLICKDTADRQILQAHKEGYSLFEAIVEGRVKLK